MNYSLGKLNILLILLLVVSCTNHYEEGKKFFNNRDYEKSIIELNQVQKDNDSYNDARLLLMSADSILKSNKRKEFFIDSVFAANEKIKRDSVALVEKRLAEQNEIERLKYELNRIKTFDGSHYRGEIPSLTMEVELFSTWGKKVLEAIMSDNKKIEKLGRSIQRALRSLQSREFPKIRANCAKVLKAKLWENDIEVTSLGSRRTTLQFIGRIFAANKNIKNFQTTFSKSASDFRFKRVNYKWYKYDDEYTYYNIDSEKDNKIIAYGNAH